jgi:outer membrane lipoprotein-sorting protein
MDIQKKRYSKLKLMFYQMIIIGRPKKFFNYFFVLLFFTLYYDHCDAQTVEEILQKIKIKLEKVNDYEATGKMKTNVAFIRSPLAQVKVYYQKPNKLRIVNENGISFIPKGSVNISLNNVFSDLQKYDIIDGGKDSDKLHIIKLLPKNDTSDIVLSTLYIDEKAMLVKRSKTTTRENGTYELTMSYGNYSAYGLPDKVIFSFNTKDYRLPKGITLDYDDTSDKSNDKLSNKKGTVEIDYSGYSINKGIDNKIFNQ